MPGPNRSVGHTDGPGLTRSPPSPPPATREVDHQTRGSIVATTSPFRVVAPTQPRSAHHGHRPDPPHRHPRPHLLPTETHRGQTPMEALRALKRRLSDILYRQLIPDTQTHPAP